MIVTMLVRLCYSAFRCVLDGLALLGRSRASLQAEVLVASAEKSTPALNGASAASVQ
jgi:ribonuclease PH